MKKIEDILTKVTDGFTYQAPFVSPFQSEFSKAEDEETKKVINYLFSELQCICTCWQQAWPTPEICKAAKRSWFRALVIANINTREQINKGLDVLRLRSTPDAVFVPTVGQFIAFCRPAKEFYVSEKIPALEHEKRKEVAKKALNALLDDLKR